MFKIIVKEVTTVVPQDVEGKDKIGEAKETEKEVYSQTVEKLDIKEVVKVVNEINSRY